MACRPEVAESTFKFGDLIFGQVLQRPQERRDVSVALGKIVFDVRVQSTRKLQEHRGVRLKQFSDTQEGLGAWKFLVTLQLAHP